MDAVTAYVAKSILASGLLFGYYCLALRNKKFNYYNRFYLLAAIALSLVLPVLNFKWLAMPATPNTAAGQVFILIGAPSEARAPLHFSPVWIAYAGALLVSFVFCIMLVLKIVWIFRIKQQHAGVKVQGVNLIEVAVKQAPFSFLNNLFWKKGIPLQQPEGEKIFKHELTHIQQRHTYDKLFAQAVTCIFWMNPFYWLMQKELGMIHEFIADAASIEHGDVEAFARMLLQSHNEGRYLTPTHQFFHSPIKRRLIMLTTSAKTPYSYARRVLALPVVIVTAALFSVTVGHAQTDPKLHRGDSIKIEKVRIEKSAADSSNSVTVLYKDKSGKLQKHIFKIKYKPGGHNSEEEKRIIKDSIIQKDGPASFNSNQKDIKGVECNNGVLTVYLQNGKSETYNLNDDAAIKAVMGRYGLDIATVPGAKKISKAGGITIIGAGPHGDKTIHTYNETGNINTTTAANIQTAGGISVINTNINTIVNNHAGSNANIDINSPIVITTPVKQNLNYAHIIKADATGIVVDSIPVEKLKNKAERDAVLKKYGVNQ